MDEDYAYFLPRGIEDDADEFGLGGGSSDAGGGVFSNDDDGALGAGGNSGVGRQERVNSISSGGSSTATSPRFGGSSGSSSYSHTIGAPIPSWQANLSQPVHSSAAQQAALLSLLQQQQQQQQQQHSRLMQSNYGSGGTTAADQVLSAYFSPTNSSSSGSGGVAGNSSSVASSPSPSPDSLNAHQMQFFQQLQMYQQQLLMQQQQQQQSAPSHYTRAPPQQQHQQQRDFYEDGKELVDALPGISIESGPSSPPQQQLHLSMHGQVPLQQQPPSQQQVGGVRRRPLPHNLAQAVQTAPTPVSSSAVTVSSSASSSLGDRVMPRQATVEAQPSSSFHQEQHQPQQPQQYATTPSLPPTTRTVPLPQSRAPAATPPSTWGSAAGAGTGVSVVKSRLQHKPAVTVVVASTKTENWPKASTVAAAAVAPAPAVTPAASKPSRSEERAAAKAALKEEQRKAALAAAKAAAAAKQSAKAAAASAGQKSDAALTDLQPYPRKLSDRAGGGSKLSHKHALMLAGPPVLNSGNEFDLLAEPDDESDEQSGSGSDSGSLVGVPAAEDEVPASSGVKPAATTLIASPPNNTPRTSSVGKEVSAAALRTGSKKDRKKGRKGSAQEDDGDAWPSQDPPPRDEIDEAAEEAAALAAVAAAEAAEAAEAATAAAAAAKGATEEEEDGEVVDALSEEEEVEVIDVAASGDDKSSKGLSSPRRSVIPMPPSPSPSPPISPTTGLPVSPILRRPDAPANHTRRVSFYQPPTKKQLAAQRAREQPWLAINKGASNAPGAADAAAAAASAASAASATAASANNEADHDSAASYPVESVSGVKRRGKKGKAAAAAAAVTAAAAATSSKLEDGHDVVDSTLHDDLAEPSLVKSSSVTTAASSGSSKLNDMVAHVRASAMTFFGRRGRSIAQMLFAAVSYVLGVLLGLVWTCLCVVLRLHRHAASVLSSDHQLAFCFAFLYLFPSLVRHMVYWAPPWAAPCLWYAFLMQVLCTHSPSVGVGTGAMSAEGSGATSGSNSGTPWLVSLSRVVLPLLFLTEGVSHHTLLLQLNGAERLVLAFMLGSVRTAEYVRPIFLCALAVQILLLTAVLTPVAGAHVVTQWSLILASMVVIHEPDTAALLKPAAPPAQLSRKLSAALPLPLLAAAAGVVPGVDIAGIQQQADAAGSASAGSSTPPAASSSSSSSSWLASLFGSGGMGGAFSRRGSRAAKTHFVAMQKVRRTR